ncbi:MAG: hypothetical protein LBQ65_07625 [Tannerellaceae bacterium]|jgi:hypothetical protein|nr:hypothetical protein [Tannerellaceae bacterium]
MAKTEEIQYDEEDAVKFIQNYLPQELKGKFSDDDILYLLDLVGEFYESKGGAVDLFDEDEDDDEELVAYVLKNAKEDWVGSFEPDAILHILNGELAYGESINLF